ncbi:MAG: PilZ domain-containing protein [Desulfobacteraceae bacterium]|nr:PilZ domain-containing protein [Desulfobacteraceae bacterium]
MVFNIDSLSPVSRNSIIFDSNFKNNELIISQTTPRTSKSYSFETLHITTLKTNDSDKIRLGIKCSISDFIDSYRLNKEITEQAIKISYSGRISEVNIRSAFRIKPNNVYSIMAKLIFKNKEFLSAKHFKIFDISLTGIGILIPNTSDRRENPMIELEAGDIGKIGIVMKEPGADKDVPNIKKLLNKIKIVRINKAFNQRYTLIGCQFGPWERNQEEELGKFIHQLQLFEIRHLQKY